MCVHLIFGIDLQNVTMRVHTPAMRLRPRSLCASAAARITRFKPASQPACRTLRAYTMRFPSCAERQNNNKNSHSHNATNGN